MRKLCVCAVVSLLLVGRVFAGANPYILEWRTPGHDARDSMPIGNGDIGANLWTEPNGDIVFYISKTDAWSENGRLLKVGKVRVRIEPELKTSGPNATFLQTLKVRDGVITMKYSNGQRQVTARFWIDANAPIIHLDAESNADFKLHAIAEPWRVSRRQMTNKQERHSAYGFDGKIFVEPDTVLSNRTGDVVWYHSNKRSVWKSNLELQSLGALTEDSSADPLLHRTFGAMMFGKGLKQVGPKDLVSDGGKKVELQIAVLTTVKGSASVWLSEIEKIAKEATKADLEKAFAAHKSWWNAFWERSYILASGTPEAEKVTQAYVLQRWVNACGGRGHSPIKFNGSIFTVDGIDKRVKVDADYRRWGGMYWWQNTRLPYWSMLEAGDFDLMKPLFKMFRESLGLRKAATKIYYKHAGAYYPETQYFWGAFGNENYGTDRSKLAPGLTKNTFIRYYWQGGLEFALMMLDYYHFTGDKKFARETLVPVASEILTFFDQHWKRDESGKIRFDPAESLETWHTAVNPLPEIVGIRKVAEEMLLLPESLTTKAQRKEWRKLMADLPPVPEHAVNGKKLFAPAQEYSDKRNMENPELYGIFPYRVHRVGSPYLDEARGTFAGRRHKGTKGWQQNAIQAAMLGLTETAKKMVVENAIHHRAAGFRFPAFWGPNFDWIPDQDHGNVMMIALQRMVLMYDADKIYLLPAWPKEWDLEFKLHAPEGAVVSGSVKDGRLVRWKTRPSSRKKDVVIEFK